MGKVGEARKYLAYMPHWNKSSMLLIMSALTLRTVVADSSAHTNRKYKIRHGRRHADKSRRYVDKVRQDKDGLHAGQTRQGWFACRSDQTSMDWMQVRPGKHGLDAGQTRMDRMQVRPDKDGLRMVWM